MNLQGVIVFNRSEQWEIMVQNVEEKRALLHLLEVKNTAFVRASYFPQKNHVISGLVMR